MNNDEFLLEEFRALRAEIIANMDYQKNLVIWGTAGLLTALGIIFKDPSTYQYSGLLLFLTQLIGSGFWYVWEAIAIGTERVGTYIALRHEQHTGLNWELFQRCRKKDAERLERAALPGKPAVIGDKHESSILGRPEVRPIKTFSSRLRTLAILVPFVSINFACFALIWLKLPRATLRASEAAKSIAWEIAVAPAWLAQLLRYASLAVLLMMVGFTIYAEWRLKSTARLWHEMRMRLEVARAYRRAPEDGERWEPLLP